MPTFDWYIEPYKLDINKVNVRQFKNAYFETLNMLDNMNIRHEFFKIIQTVFREGVFYGYEYKTEDSYFIQKLDPDYCKISSIEDGVFNFKFNFQYFDMDESKLSRYAPEFKTKYNNYKNYRKNNKKRNKIGDLQWQELDPKHTICIKIDETVLHSLPPFVGVLPDIYEIQDYKSLKKANSELQNYAFITGNIPINTKSDEANDFKVDLDTSIEFGNKILEQLPDQVGFLLSIFDDMKLFKLNDDKVGNDKVEEAVNSFWNSTGVSKNLFADSGNTDAAMEYSVIADEELIFGLLRQFERWLNRKLKYNNKKYKFRVNMLDITRYNRKSKVSEELKAAQFGVPNKIRLATSLGMSQSSISSMEFLENDVLKIHENWIPLNSSYINPGTSPTEGEPGKPSSEQNKNRIDNGGED